jgi:predicted lipoprotein with Yx(FWY)xxD motif
MKHPRAAVAAIGLSVAAIAGGVTVVATAGGSTPSSAPVATASATNPTSTPTPPAAPAAPAAPTAPAAMVTLHTASATVAGATETILVDARGFPLYIYQPDTATKSQVSGELAFLWPPLDATAPTAVGTNGTLKVVNTANGHQVAYNGHFLYTFRQDSPGVVTGQGVQNFFVATPGISTLKSPPPATPAPAPAPATSGYGGY